MVSARHHKLDSTIYGFSVRAAMPGRVLPSRNSREAPPPVETWDILPATPNFSTAAAVSPPPTTDVTPLSEAMCWARDFVPSAKGSISKTPTGPFQRMVLALESSDLKRSTLLGPVSRPIQRSEERRVG